MDKRTSDTTTIYIPPPCDCDIWLKCKYNIGLLCMLFEKINVTNEIQMKPRGEILQKSDLENRSIQIVGQTDECNLLCVHKNV